jgi:hypothetical protein
MRPPRTQLRHPPNIIQANPYLPNGVQEQYSPDLVQGVPISVGRGWSQWYADSTPCFFASDGAAAELPPKGNAYFAISLKIQD